MGSIIHAPIIILRVGNKPGVLNDTVIPLSIIRNQLHLTVEQLLQHISDILFTLSVVAADSSGAIAGRVTLIGRKTAVSFSGGFCQSRVYILQVPDNSLNGGMHIV